MIAVSHKVQDQNFVFIGNRIFVLEAMFAHNLKIKHIFAKSGSHLDRQMRERGIQGSVFHSKDELFAALRAIDFDVLVSNGCPYLLPTKGYFKSDPLLVNIHPSFLPDLPGKDPVPGALLYERDSGATCHIIDSGIDTGPIISQVRIPYVPHLDAGILYQLSFWAEQEVFCTALANNFVPSHNQSPVGDEIYFSRSAVDQKIDFRADSCEQIVRKVTAFGNRSQGVSFFVGDLEFKAHAACLINIPFLSDRVSTYSNGEVIFCYDDVIILYKDKNILKLECVSGPLQFIKAHDRLIT